MASMQTYVDDLKLKLTGGILELEIPDDTLEKVINSAFREVQRYIDTTRIETIPYSNCIDLSPRKVNAVTRVYRAEGFYGNDDAGSRIYDPLYATQWQILGGNGNLYNFQDYTYNVGAWNTMLQIRNTMSTDLIFRYERSNNKLYVNVSSGTPSSITVEYIPRFDDVSEIDSDYWIDIISRLSLALAKITLGRIRTRFTQSNALWTQDGETMLNEGNTELTELREHLKTNTQLIYGID